jgi:hypothetical protein
MQQNETLKVSGTVRLRSHPAGTTHLMQTLMEMGKIEQAQEILKEGKIEVEQKNLIVDSSNYGIDILVQYLISAYVGSLNFPLGIAWGEIGTGNTTPTNTDTALTTPTNRAAVSYAFDNGFTTASVQFFFPDGALANTTYYECGSFIGGNSTIGTGNMFNHALFGTSFSKSAGTDVTLEVDIQFANS